MKPIKLLINSARKVPPFWKDNKMRVLMIDDEPVFFKMAASVLKNKGYGFEFVRNGRAGLASIVCKLRPKNHKG